MSLEDPDATEFQVHCPYCGEDVEISGARSCFESLQERADCELVSAWSPRLAQRGEMIRHALKLSPQEQVVAAFGFFTLKPPSFSAST